VIGGAIKQARDGDDVGQGNGHRVYEIYTNVAPGQTRTVNIAVSGTPDTIAPVGGIAINGGQALAAIRDVTLNIAATDSGGSRLKDMMISNRDDFKGADWEPYGPVVQWQLTGGAPGRRVVYVKFRDYAMPPNVSNVTAAGIDYISVQI
jgi:hypothetical protein